MFIGFVLLVKGADFLVRGASSLAGRLKVSDLSVGLTIVAFGTSTPELFVNIFASLRGDPAIAIGNILGSNIVNVLLILGISAVIYPLKVQRNTVWKEIPLSLLAAVLVMVLSGDRSIDRLSVSAITRIDGIVLLLFFVIFLYYVFSIAKDQDAQEVLTGGSQSLAKIWFLILAGFIGLVAGGRLIVDNAVHLAGLWGVSESLIGLTIVAAGTSLPELATSAVAAYRKNTDIAVGNIVGSNIFNIFFILGTSAVIKPLPFAARDQVDVLVMIASSLLLFVCMFTGRRRLMDRWEGVLFTLLYAGYIVFLIKRG